MYWTLLENWTLSGSRAEEYLLGCPTPDHVLGGPYLLTTLAGQAWIPPDDLMLDMFDKLTLELCCTILPQYTTITALKELTDQYQAVDQGLWHIKAETDCLKKNQVFTEKYRVQKPGYTLHQVFTERNQSVKLAEVMQAPVCNRGSVL
jgi:hypothetical protein